MDWEYGIRVIGTKHMHRESLSEEEAHRFMSAETWGGHTPRVVFEVVRRLPGAWQPVD